MSIVEFNEALKNNSFDDILIGLNPKTRLPNSNATWSGKKGESLWFSDNPDALAITNGEGVPFKNGRVDLTQWSKGSIEFDQGVLNGSSNDFSEVYKKIMKDYELPSQKAAEQMLKDLGLTPHHSSTTMIELIPTDLHKNIPHIGTASDLRGIE